MWLPSNLDRCPRAGASGRLPKRADDQRGESGSGVPWPPSLSADTAIKNIEQRREIKHPIAAIWLGP